MYQIKATLRNKDIPESGTATVTFPIPWREYDRVLEQLKLLGIGGPTEQDCQVEAIDSHYSILKRLEEMPVNLDELDYLAKRLDGFDVYEALQFQGAAAAEGVITIRDFINLTFCCQQATVVQDFRDLEKIGKDHLMALGDGSASIEEWKTADFRKIARDLLQSGEGKVTPYSVVYENGMELRPLYYGGPFPAYGCGEPLVVAFRTVSSSTCSSPWRKAGCAGSWSDAVSSTRKTSSFAALTKPLWMRSCPPSLWRRRTFFPQQAGHGAGGYFPDRERKAESRCLPHRTGLLRKTPCLNEKGGAVGYVSAPLIQ